MGFWSYTCAKSNLPILASTSWGDRPECCTVVALGRNGSVIHGQYDGYGRILGEFGETELDDCGVLSGEIKLVLKKFYNGEPWEKLQANRSDPGQGHFHSDEAIDAWFAQGGFKTRSEMMEAYKNWKDAPAHSDTQS